MTIRRRMWVIGWLGALLAACGAESESASRPAATSSQAPAGSGAAPTSGPGSTASTTALRLAPPTTAVAPRQLVTDPRAAPPGTRVRVTGRGFIDEEWRRVGVPFWLVGGPAPPGCDLFAEADHDIRVDADGVLFGSFVVPGTGGCRMEARGTAVVPGTYRFSYACTACRTEIGGSFEVLAASPAPAACEAITFTPNSDHGIFAIVAYGLPCAEATAVLRQLPGSGSTTSRPANGFTCDHQTFEPPLAMERGVSVCSRGAQRITFSS